MYPITEVLGEQLVTFPANIHTSDMGNPGMCSSLCDPV